MLSVTIVLSFSLFLCYLFITDSQLYNENKDLFKLSRNVVAVYHYGNINPSKMGLLREKVKEIDETYAMPFYETDGIFSTTPITEQNGISAEVYGSSSIICIPDHAWDVYAIGSISPLEITWIDGRNVEDITLAQDEMLMSEGVFYGLGLDKTDNPVYTIRVMSSEAVSTPCISLTMKVVGLIKDKSPLIGDSSGAYDVDKNLSYVFYIVVPIKTLNPQKVENANWREYSLFYSGNPEQVQQLSQKFGYYTSSVFELQNDALTAAQYEVKNKATIAILLLLLLSINLYSSFANVLQNRKFEIGVKRAIGASNVDILKQFIYESLYVMLINITLSVTLVVDIMISYKYISFRIPDPNGVCEKIILYISPYSIAIFLVCAIALTCVFSVVFAYKSTKVEIVSYLKSE